MIKFGDDTVSLAPLDSEHMETIRAWRNDPAIYKWCRQSDLITDRAQAEWFERQAKDSSIKMYAIHDSTHLKIVGVCGLTSIDMLCRRAEFSIYIAPEFQKLGIGKKALIQLIHHGFKNLGLNSIWGETFDGNPAAKMFESLGFKKEGTRRAFYFKSGEFIDAHLYSVLESEWT